MRMPQNSPPDYSHPHARRDIEIHADGLLPPQRQTFLDTHLAACPDCRAYLAEFTDLEQSLTDLFKSNLPEVKYTSAQLQLFSRDVKARTHPPSQRFRLPQWFHSLSWAGTLTLTLLGMIWVLNNTKLDQRPPIENPPALTLALETPPALTYILPGSDPVHQVIYSPDGNLLAAASGDGSVDLWQVSNGSLWKTIETGLHSVDSLVFTPNGSQLLTLETKTGTLQIWYTATGDLLQTIEDIPGQPHFVGILPTGQVQFLRQPNEFLLQPAPDVEIPWATRQGEVSRPIILPALAGEILTASISPDGKILATGSKSGSIYFWQITVDGGQRTGTPLLFLKGHTGSITTLAFHPNGEHLISASGDGTLRVWHVATGTARYTLAEHMGSIQSLAFAPDGSSLAAAMEDGTIHLWVAENP